MSAIVRLLRRSPAAADWRRRSGPAIRGSCGRLMADERATWDDVAFMRAVAGGPALAGLVCR
jgi:hypothetical protein